MSELVVYRASAGSGKTFRLAVEYISRVVVDPQSYSSILCVTFTNKATGEMKERILSQLYGISVGDSGSKAYLQCVMDRTGYSSDLVCERCAMALSFILHDYSGLNIVTLDAFAVSVLHSLSRELGVGMNVGIELDSGGALSDSVDQLLSDLSDGDEALTWISEYMYEKINDNHSWSTVIDEMKNFGNFLFNEQLVEYGDDLQKELRDAKKVSAFKQSIYTYIDDIKHRLSDNAAAYDAALSQAGLSGDDLKGAGRNAANSFYRKVREGLFDALSITDTFLRLLDDSESWAKKYRHDEVVSLAETTLIPLLQDAYHLWQEYQSCYVSLTHINNLRLLGRIGEALYRVMRDRGQFLLANINGLLHTFVKDSDTPFIFEKLGGRIEVIMMDEFQDTSRLQWKNFRPLLLEGIARGGDSLIVGDVKQSIYRWRNGDWRILNSELRHTFGPYPLVEKSLSENRRSDRHVIEHNNAFFSRAWRLLDERYSLLGADGKGVIEMAYRDVCQEVVKDKSQGYVQVAFIKKDGGAEYDSYDLAVLAALVRDVDQLIAQGCAERDIAILVRRTRHIKLIADYFSQHSDYHVVSDEAYRLDASQAVGVIISALRCLAQRDIWSDDNKLLVAQLAVEYTCGVLQEPVAISTIVECSVAEMAQRYLPQRFVHSVEELVVMGLYDCVETLYDMFHLDRIANQEGYLLAFYDSVMAYCTSHESDIGAFVKTWDSGLNGKTLPVGEVDGIRLLTIHKSKGLEYHSVLVPFCDWTLEDTRHPETLWCSPGRAPYDGLTLLPITYHARLRDTIFADDYLSEQLSQWVDNLNLLYVAFTRARTNLFIYGKSEPECTGLAKMTNVSRLIYETMARINDAAVTMCDGDLPDGVDTMWTRGTLLPKEHTSSSVVTNQLLLPSKVEEVPLVACAPAYTFRQSNASAEFINDNAGSKEYINRGLLLHSLFEHIITTDDIPRGVNELLRQGLISTPEQVEKLTTFAQEAIRKNPYDWFSGRWTVRNESSILFSADDSAVVRRPDRLMTAGDTAVIVDYKFGREHEHYYDQVKEYMTLIESMGYPTVKGYIWYVFDNNIQEIQ